MKTELGANSTESNEIGNKVLTASLADRVFITALKFSRYNETLQDDFFVSINKIRPMWSMDDPMKKEVFETAYPTVLGLVSHDNTIQQPVSEEEIKLLVERQLTTMQDKFTGIKEAKGIGDPLQIAQLMLLEDLGSYYRFREACEGSDNVTKSYVSQFCKYVIEQQPTGLDVFDTLFTVVKRDFESVNFREGPYIKMYKYLSLIKDVVSGYVETNPEKREFYEKMGFI